jgi:hypothetical protein
MADGTLGLVLQGCFRIDGYRRPTGAPGPLPGIWPLTGRGRLVAQPLVAGPAGTSWLAPRLVRTMGLPAPLDPELRPQLEDFFQEGLSAVTVHRGPIAGMLGAAAVTIADQIGLGPGAGHARTREGLWLLSHELAHVLQQRQARVINRDPTRLLLVRDPLLDQEAAELAARAAAWVGRTSVAARGAGTPFRIAGPGIPGQVGLPTGGGMAAQAMEKKKKKKSKSEKNREANLNKEKQKKRRAATTPLKAASYSPDAVNQAERAAVRGGATGNQLPAIFTTAAATQPGGAQRIGHASQSGGAAQHPATGGMVSTYVKHVNSPRAALVPNPNHSPPPARRKGK